MIYVLGTDICSDIIRRQFPHLNQRIETFSNQELKVSSISVFELEFGALRSQRTEHLQRVISRLLDLVQVLPFDLRAAKQAGEIRAILTSQGRKIGAYDTQIAGHSRSLGATLITNNVREFSRVPDLEIENWTELPRQG